MGPRQVGRWASGQLAAAVSAAAAADAQVGAAAAAAAAAAGTVAVAPADDLYKCWAVAAAATRCREIGTSISFSDERIE
eukprot:3791343-Pleurochrysis_carterae.AAC.1